MGQGQEGLESGLLAFAKACHVLAAFPTGQEGTEGNHEDIEEVVLLRSQSTSEHGIALEDAVSSPGYRGERNAF